MTTGSHCCACAQVCMHVGGPWLCARHMGKPAAPPPTVVVMSPESGVAAEMARLRAEVARLTQERDAARAELDRARVGGSYLGVLYAFYETWMHKIGSSDPGEDWARLGFASLITVEDAHLLDQAAGAVEAHEPEIKAAVDSYREGGETP